MELKITLDQTGKMQVAGPIENQVLCYGMVEQAKDLIREYHRKKADGPQIVAAPAAALGQITPAAN